MSQQQRQLKQAIAKLSRAEDQLTKILEAILDDCAQGGETAAHARTVLWEQRSFFIDSASIADKWPEVMAIIERQRQEL